ncbi:MAG: thymidylate synthase [bacterium]
MKQYQDLLQNIVNNGIEKESGRPNMPNTIGISNATITMDLNDGFPLLTTKKMYWKGIVHELLWFLRGETNIKYLVDNKVNIWNQDAYRWYLKYHKKSNVKTPPLTIEQFVDTIKNNEIKNPHFEGSDYCLGDLGKVYGYQWRNQNGVDQVKDVLNGLKTNPYSRYHIIDGWNKADFPEMALPPCHLLYQFIVRPMSFKERRDLAYKYAVENNKIPLLIDAHGDTGTPEYMRVIDETGWNIPKFYLDLNMYQRSVDTFLGCPFNLASMSLMLMIFAKASNMIAGKAFWIGGDTHLYVNHMPMVVEQLSRDPRPLPKMFITKQLYGLDDILSLSIDDFQLLGYDPHPTIKAELFTGIKK